MSWDGQGLPVGPPTISLASTSQALLQAEWPIPTRWELQLDLALSCVAGGPATWNGATGSLNVKGHIESSVESAMVTQTVQLIFGPGVYPLQAAVNGIPGLSSTFPVIGQTVRVKIDEVVLAPDVALAGTSWAWTVNVVCGLTSAGWPG